MTEMITLFSARVLPTPEPEESTSSEEAPECAAPAPSQQEPTTEATMVAEDVDDDEEEVICSICLSDDLEHLQATACGHSFCTTCLGRYALVHRRAQSHFACPLCRRSLNNDPAIPKTVEFRFARTPPFEENGGVTLASSAYGVVVGAVAPTSPAAAVGVRPKWPVSSINGQPVTSRAHGAKHLAEAGAEREVVLEVPLAVSAGRALYPADLVADDRRTALPVNHGRAGLRRNGLDPDPAADLGISIVSEDPSLNMASCCCYCIVLGQLAQRVLVPRRFACGALPCVLVATTFWLLSCFSMAAEMSLSARTYAGDEDTTTGAHGGAGGANATAATPTPPSARSSSRQGYYDMLQEQALWVDAAGLVAWLTAWALGCVLVFLVRRKLLRGVPADDDEWRLGANSVACVCCTASRMLSRLGVTAHTYELCSTLPTLPSNAPAASSRGGGRRVLAAALEVPAAAPVAARPAGAATAV